MIPSHQPKGDASADFLPVRQRSSQRGEDFKGYQTVAGDTAIKAAHLIVEAETEIKYKMPDAGASTQRAARKQ
jgi:hypothetical protein